MSETVWTGKRDVMIREAVVTAVIPKWAPRMIGRIIAAIWATKTVRRFARAGLPMEETDKMMGKIARKLRFRADMERYRGTEAWCGVWREVRTFGGGHLVVEVSVADGPRRKKQEIRAFYLEPVFRLVPAKGEADG